MRSSSQAPQSRPTRQFYDSRTAPSAGIGFPSLCTDLVRAPRNTADPHGYYEELGVDPSASESEIRAAARRLYRDLHPDTGDDPDPERLTRVRNIVGVLLDPAERFKYDHTPEGQRLNDKVYREELSKLDSKVVREVLDRSRATRPPVGRFDYFSLGWKTTDALKAQQWYHYLLGKATVSRFKGRLRLLLWDGNQPAWQASKEVLMVPRSWEPSAFTAEVLLTKVIGTTGNSNIATTAPDIGGAMSNP